MRKGYGMKKQEAINLMKLWRASVEMNGADSEHLDAFDMAIDALMKQLKAEKDVNRITKLKPCPYRVHKEQRKSLTVEGEYFYNETFMPCMQHKCPCFHCECGDAYCDRDGVYRKLGEMAGEEDDEG